MITNIRQPVNEATNRMDIDRKNMAGNSGRNGDLLRVRMNGKTLNWSICRVEILLEKAENFCLPK
jgi:hypothetical protein